MLSQETETDSEQLEKQQAFDLVYCSTLFSNEQHLVASVLVDIITTEPAHLETTQTSSIVSEVRTKELDVLPVLLNGITEGG